MPRCFLTRLGPLEYAAVRSTPPPALSRSQRWQSHPYRTGVLVRICCLEPTAIRTDAVFAHSPPTGLPWSEPLNYCESPTRVRFSAHANHFHPCKSIAIIVDFMSRGSESPQGQIPKIISGFREGRGEDGQARNVVVPESFEI